jgi:hypothetical protein
LLADQHIDLPEWLDYHRRLGVSHFYVMDDGSSPPLDDVLAPYVQAGAWGADALTGALSPASAALLHASLAWPPPHTAAPLPAVVPCRRAW